MMDDTSGSTSQLWAISAVPTFLPGIGSTSWELIKMLPIAFFFFFFDGAQIGYKNSRSASVTLVREHQDGIDQIWYMVLHGIEY